MRTRRDFLAAGLAAGLGGRGVPVVHVTDLYRPHQDPDDHWDLACVFALARMGAYDPRTVLMDAPVWGKGISSSQPISAVVGWKAMAGARK